jgi:hypothetical protein
MSQIFFMSKYYYDRVQVMTGWDRPLQHFFLTLLNPAAKEDEEEVVWSSMSDIGSDLGGGYPDSEKIIQLLDEMKIVYPDNLKETLDRHRAENIGNERVWLSLGHRRER